MNILSKDMNDSYNMGEKLDYDEIQTLIHQLPIEYVYFFFIINIGFISVMFLMMMMYLFYYFIN